MMKKMVVKPATFYRGTVKKQPKPKSETCNNELKTIEERLEKVEREVSRMHEYIMYMNNPPSPY